MSPSNPIIHIPVLLEEVLVNFSPSPGERYIDCTTGEGGHSFAIAKMIAPSGEVLSIDADPQELELFEGRVADYGLETIITGVCGNFSELESIAKKYKFMGSNGILFDLGFSSWQIEKSGRGFTFQKNEPLDMRFNSRDDTKPTAADILNSAPKDYLVKIFKEYSQERNAEKIALEIVRSRKKDRLSTTGDLVNLISSVVPGRGRINPATKVFQALRITVNQEFENIENGLDAALSVVTPGGKIAVITFHSLEDRIVKNIFRNWANQSRGDNLTKKVIKPKYEEIKSNPRSRSAKLRIFLKK